MAAEVAAAVVVGSSDVHEAPECYICMEAETALMPFLKKPMCACSSKADSSLKVHQLCLELSRDSTGKCAVCKTPLSGDWAFDPSFKRINGYYDSARTFVQMQGQAKHGAEYALKSTNAYMGPMRYLAAKGQYAEDKLDGPQFTYQADCSAATESNYVAGVLHGLLVERDAKGVVTLEENYAQNILHGLRRVQYHGIYLTGQYEAGVKVGQHLEVATKKERIYHAPTLTLMVNKATYAAGTLDGPFLQYHVKVGESLPTETAMYRNGKLHGLQEKWIVDADTLERQQTLEAHWIEGVRNGRHATFIEGKPDMETWYYMDKKHGLERSFFSDGRLYEEVTWHLDEKHGRVRKWALEGGKRVLETDAAYDNGFRHGRFVTVKMPENWKIANNTVVTEDFWSDGSKEIRHGVHKIVDESLSGKKVVRQESHYKMGVRHGLSLKHNRDGSGFVLNYSNGKLHGKCRVMNDDRIEAEGNFSNGIPVGKHQLFTPSGCIRESVNYDSEGRLHGKCIFNQSNGTPFQSFNYENGVLHGRQVLYYAGTQRELRVFNMRRGYVHGRFTMYDERGAIEEQRLIKQDEGVSLQECLGLEALCYPSERLADGTYEFRYMTADGTTYKCKHAAAGRNECMCDECWVPADEKEEAECNCAFCREDSEASKALRDQASVYDEQDYVEERNDWDYDDEDDEDRYRRGRRYSDY